MSKEQQVRILTLNDGDFNEDKLFSVMHGVIVYFTPGHSLYHKIIKFYLNYPADGENFSRKKYRELKWINPNKKSSKNDNFNQYAAVQFNKCGTFHYYFTEDESDRQVGNGYVVVYPILNSYDGQPISKNGLQCQTLLAKCLGRFDEWLDRIMVTVKSGFNMVHITPLQELCKISNSSYAIRDHLTFNPVFGNVTKKQLVEFIAKLYEEHQLISVSDLVYNHVAVDCPLLKKYPSASYNLQNSPYLRPAFVFDYIIYQFTLDVANGKLNNKGIPDRIEPYHLERIRNYLLHEVLPRYRFHEFVMANVDVIVGELNSRLHEVKTLKPNESFQGLEDLKLYQDPEYKRFGSWIDLDLATDLLDVDWHDRVYREDKIRRSCELLREHLDRLNNEARDRITDDVVNGVNACIGNAKYWFFDSNMYSRLSEATPLAPRYFTFPWDGISVEEAEMICFDSQKCCQIMAFNGWLIGGGVDTNLFAEEGSRSYLRRELVIWTDLVKTRFGKKPEDCPELWSYMEQYTRDTVDVFHAVRLDNCHSTPLHVAEYMMDIAREQRPNVYIFAELFTGSEQIDNQFVNKIGITSLVRESMGAGSAYELGGYIHRYGGDPVGAFYQPPVRPLIPRIANAMFYDVTHDNMSPIKVRSIYDMLPRMFLSNMVCCSTGSSRGFDELVPHNLDVVTENRFYRKWKPSACIDQSFVAQSTGIIAARIIANKLHYHMAQTNFSQIYVDQVTNDTIAVTRHNPSNHNSIILVARTSFTKPDNPKQTDPNIRPMFVPGRLEKILFEARLEEVADIRFVADDSLINGLLGYNLSIREDVNVEESQFVHYTNDGNEGGYVRFKDFGFGSVIAFKTTLSDSVVNSLNEIRKHAADFGVKDGKFHSLIKALSPLDLNTVLYRCGAEEVDDCLGFGPYTVPNFGDLVYCGLQGIMSVLERIRLGNDLGHPICVNLREGDWLPQYIAHRLIVHKTTKELGIWYDEIFKHLAKLPRYLVPSYFDAILTGSYARIIEHAISLYPPFIRQGSSLSRVLAMTSIQLVGRVKSAKMPPLSSQLSPPKPAIVFDEYSDHAEEQLIPCFSAGLQHFSTGVFRNWGRDTFIALRGLLLLTGRTEEARFIILSYGQTMRHGLIPNLLADGTHARYNCRDAFWWWLYSIVCYIKWTSSTTILADRVALGCFYGSFRHVMYPTDESDPHSPAGATDLPLHQVIHNSLEKHYKGISFRERNAGTLIDENMTDAGFNIEVGVDKSTGFVYGGNEYNCGTWMDKMGGSVKAGNKGLPATPRDGSAVEIVGLSYACIKFLSQLNEQDYPNKKIEATFTLLDWSLLIEKNFEKHFWIDERVDESMNDVSLVNRRGIYKDVYRSSHRYTDYQLRPNFLIALVVAPELCNPEHALEAIRNAETILMGKFGMKTLDPSDWNYRGYYDNSDDSDDRSVAQGWNYHQGPEWLWLSGYLYRAMLLLTREHNPSDTVAVEQKCRRILGKQCELLLQSPWKGLPELTNVNGSPCRFSCETQAWSAASLLELLHDLVN
ncbi:hypothetical protein ACOME3_006533 [Neoechinorhynchus agilis]